MKCSCAATSDIGHRQVNQDSYVCYPEKGLWLVADGVGGLSSGEVASAISSYTIATQFAAGEGINQSIEAAHRAIKDYSETEGGKCNFGSALVLLLSVGRVYNIFWAGDCRAYLYDKELKQLTHDHTYLQSLIDSGELSQEEAGSYNGKDGITRALGIRQLEAVRADSTSGKWQPGQKILLCSDGLSGYVSKEDIEAVLKQNVPDQDRVDTLVNLAKVNGSRDNITVLLITAPSYIVDDEDDTEMPVEELEQA